MRRTLRHAVALSPRRIRKPTPAADLICDDRRWELPSLERLETRTLFAAGDLDATFGPGGVDGNGIITTNIVTGSPSFDAGHTILVQPDNKILVGGTSDAGLGSDFTLARYNPDGTLDTGFGGGDGIVTTDFGDADVLESIALTEGGRVVAVGSTGSGSFVDWALARYNPNGSIDTSFAPGGADGDGKLTLDFFTRADTADAVTTDANNKIVVAGTATGQTTQIAVARLNADGTFDGSFVAPAIDNTINAVVVQTDGKAFADVFAGADAAADVEVQSDNKVVVAGSSAPVGSYRRFVLVRFNPDGSRDAAFGDPTLEEPGQATSDFGAGAYAKDVVIEPGGKYVVGGLLDTAGSFAAPNFAVARFNADGTLDTSFGSGGRSAVSNFGGAASAHYGLARQTDGKFLLGGLVVSDGGTQPDGFGIARFNADGAPDTTFGTGGTVRTTVPGASSTGGADLALQADNKIVMAGQATFEATSSDFAVARYLNNVVAPASISGTVFEDVNANGVFDAGERPLEGWTVFQDVNGNGTLDTGNATVNSTDVPKPIADNATVPSTLNVSGLLGTILDVNVALTIEHTFDPDLDVTLISPRGTRVLLFSGVGTIAGETGSANFDNTILDDQAADSINGGRPPFRGSYRPQQRLAALIGQDPTGTWTLEIRDTAGGDTGSLEAWSVTIVTRGEPSVVTGADGSYSFPNLTPGTYTIRQVLRSGYTQSTPANGAAHVITLAEGQQETGRNFGNFSGTIPSEVVGRRIFYNNSSFDGRDPAPEFEDLAAVATDKQALLPGQFADFLNVTTYSRGINGIIIELRNLGASATLTAADFQFRAGNSTDPSGWAAAPAPLTVMTLRSPEPEAPARVHITWADGAITNKWLQVTSLANANTGLRAPDVFYFGNLPGETGDQPFRLVTVTQRDELLVRRALRARGAGITSHYDFDRDGDVDSMDVLVVRRNIGARLSSLGGPESRAPGPGAAGTSAFSGVPVALNAAALRPARVWTESAAAAL